VYGLQIDDRSPEDSQATLQRYLSRDRVRSGAALDAATQDYRDATAKREAARALPRAWSQLVQGSEDLLVELLSDQAEALSGFRPEPKDVTDFLRSLSATGTSAVPIRTPEPKSVSPVLAATLIRQTPAQKSSRAVEYAVLGQDRHAKNANEALVAVLSALARRYPDRVADLAAAVQGSTRNHIARSVQEIYPARPDLARATEFAPGWLVGLNIANREKKVLFGRPARSSVYGSEQMSGFRFRTNNVRHPDWRR
jgi:hypothetical protein